MYSLSPEVQLLLNEVTPLSGIGSRGRVLLPLDKVAMGYVLMNYTLGYHSFIHYYRC